MARTPLKSATIKSISKLLGDTTRGFNGQEITRYLSESNIPEIDTTISTKWQRLDSELSNKQATDKCSNNILSFIEKVARSSWAPQ
jgi:hypothetical protein